MNQLIAHDSKKRTIYHRLKAVLLMVFVFSALLCCGEYAGAEQGAKMLRVALLNNRPLSYEAGANSYLIKPVSFDDFLKVIRQVADYWLSLNIGPPA